MYGQQGMGQYGMGQQGMGQQGMQPNNVSPVCRELGGKLTAWCACMGLLELGFIFTALVCLHGPRVRLLPQGLLPRHSSAHAPLR